MRRESARLTDEKNTCAAACGAVNSLTHLGQVLLHTWVPADRGRQAEREESGQSYRRVPLQNSSGGCAACSKPASIFAAAQPSESNSQVCKLEDRCRLEIPPRQASEKIHSQMRGAVLSFDLLFK